MMTCSEAKKLLNAYVDGELDSTGSLTVESHIERCASCLANIEQLRGLASAITSSGLRFKAPQRLKRKVEAAIREADPKRKRAVFGWRWGTAFASAAVLLIAGWVGLAHYAQSSREALLVNDLVSSHVRSMMANHITDVASSDSHTVKPWFGGKLDYSPPATDLTEQGFRLVGGRLDYLSGRPVAAVVYQRSQHFINLFVWPSDEGGSPREDQLSQHGYNLIHWTKAGLTYWLVSELNTAELNECARLLQQ